MSNGSEEFAKQIDAQIRAGTFPAPLPASDSPVLDLEAIRRRMGIVDGHLDYDGEQAVFDDVTALLAEVDRLRALHASTEIEIQDERRSAYAEGRLAGLDERSELEGALCEPCRGDRVESKASVCAAHYASAVQALADAQAELDATEGALRQVVEQLKRVAADRHACGTMQHRLRETIGQLSALLALPLGATETKETRDI